MPWLPAPDLPLCWLPCSLRSAAILAELLCTGSARDIEALLADPGCVVWMLHAFPEVEPGSALARLQVAELPALLAGEQLPNPPEFSSADQRAPVERFAVQQLAAALAGDQALNTAQVAWQTARYAQALGRTFAQPAADGTAEQPFSQILPHDECAAAVRRAWEVVLDPQSATEDERTLLREALQSAAQSFTQWQQEWPGPGRQLTELARLITRSRAAHASPKEFESAKLAALAEFAAGAGHDMNNPLAVISARAQLLLRGEADVERRTQLAIIQAQVQRVHEMIVDVMLFARPPAAKRTAVALGPLLAEQTALLQALPTWSNVRIECALAADVPPVVGDPELLRPLWAALLQNAYEALGGKGVIQVELCATGPREGRASGAEVRIANNGPPISESTRRHLFDPFYSGRQAGRGLGFGLSKAWRIVTLLGGSIAADEAAHGAAFRVWLPAWAVESPADS